MTIKKTMGVMHIHQIRGGNGTMMTIKETMGTIGTMMILRETMGTTGMTIKKIIWRIGTITKSTGTTILLSL